MIPFIDLSPTQKLIALAKGAGIGSYEEATATGNPLTFQTDLARPLKSLLIPFTPVQSGSGDPSPQNVRPIVPWEGLTVWNGGKNLLECEIGATKSNNGVDYVVLPNHGINCKGETVTYSSYGIDSKKIQLKAGTYAFSVSGATNVKTVFVKNNEYWFGISGSGSSAKTITADSEVYCYFMVTSGNEVDETVFVQLEVGSTASSYEEYKPITETDISFPSTIYGGYVDMVTGEVWEAWESYTFTGEEQMGVGTYSGTGGIRINSTVLDSLVPQYNTGISNKAKKESSIPSTISQLGFRISSGTSLLAFFVPDSMFDGEATVEKFKSWLSENGLMLCVELSTHVLIATLSPQQITALKGDNTIWSDANGRMTAVFLKKK